MKLIGEHVRIIYIPDSICGVEVPGTWRELLRQRIGWHRQLASSLWAQRSMIFNPYTQSTHFQRGDASAIVCMYGDVLVQTTEQSIPYVWPFAGYGIEEGRREEH